MSGGGLEGLRRTRKCLAKLNQLVGGTHLCDEVGDYVDRWEAFEIDVTKSIRVAVEDKVVLLGQNSSRYRVLTASQALVVAIYDATRAVRQLAASTPHCYLTIVKALLERGADRQHADSEGRNALHLAYKNLKQDEDSHFALPVEDRIDVPMRRDGRPGVGDDDIPEVTNRAELWRNQMLHGPVSETIRYLQRNANLSELELTKDKDGNPPFTKQQREEYYITMADTLDVLCEATGEGQVAEGMPLHKLKRTQIAVDHKWSQEFKAIRCCTLLLWVSYIFVSFFVFTDHLGVLTTPAYSLHNSFEEILVYDEYDSHPGGREHPPGINGFANIINQEEWWMWMMNVAADVAYRNGTADGYKFRRDPDSPAVSTMEEAKAGAMNKMSFLIGRPRIRQLRVNATACTNLGWGFSPFSQGALDTAKDYQKLSGDVCFFDYHNRYDERNFTVGNSTARYMRYTYAATRSFEVLPPDLQSWGFLRFGRYPFEGHSFVLPRNPREGKLALENLRKNNWIDMNTRVVFFEFSAYNANNDMVIVGRLQFEMDTLGNAVPSWEFRTLKLHHYSTEFDAIRAGVFESLYVLFVLYWFFEEVRQCCPTLRSREGVEMEEMRRRRLRAETDHEGCCMRCCSYFVYRYCCHLCFICYSCGGRSCRRVCSQLDEDESDSVKTIQNCAVDCYCSPLRICCCLWPRRLRKLGALNTAAYFVDDPVMNSFDIMINLGQFMYIAVHGLSFFVTAEIDQVVKCQVSHGADRPDYCTDPEQLGGRGGGYDEFVGQVWEASMLNTIREYMIMVVMMFASCKTMEYLKINKQYADYYYILIGMVSRLFQFFILFLVILGAFFFAFYSLSRDSDDHMDSVFTGFFTQLERSGGALDFAAARDGSESGMTLTLMFVFFLLVVLIMMNLMIAVMSEAIEEVKSEARARWCLQQHQDLVQRREHKTEFLPYYILSLVRRLYNICKARLLGHGSELAFDDRWFYVELQFNVEREGKETIATGETPASGSQMREMTPEVQAREIAREIVKIEAESKAVNQRKISRHLATGHVFEILEFNLERLELNFIHKLYDNLKRDIDAVEQLWREFDVERAALGQALAKMALENKEPDPFPMPIDVDDDPHPVRLQWVDAMCYGVDDLECCDDKDWGPTKFISHGLSLSHVLPTRYSDEGKLEFAVGRGLREAKRDALNAVSFLDPGTSDHIDIKMMWNEREWVSRAAFAPAYSACSSCSRATCSFQGPDFVSRL